MSETQTAPKPPPLDGAITITDDTGRTLQVRALDIVEELDLIEAAGGENAANSRWMMVVTFAACVRSVDGLPKPTMIDKRPIRAWVQRVGPAGMRAVVKALAPADVPEDAADAIAAGPYDAAKN